MEKNDTNTDYHKFVRLGEQKWEIVEITKGIIFFIFVENNDTNTDYHKFVRLGEQKWEIVEITKGIIFFIFV